VGRHPDCDIPVDHPDASRHHAQIVFVNNVPYLEDLHSRNGTFLNGERIQGRKRLYHGDRIRVSEVVFEVDLSDWLHLEEETPPVTMDNDRPSRVLVVAQPDTTSTLAVGRSPASVQSELNALLEITQNLLQNPLSLDSLMPAILDTLFRIFPSADRAFVVLGSEEGTLVPRWMKLRDGGGNKEIRISSTIVNRVMESQQAVLSADAADDSCFQISDSLSDEGIRSVICAPIIDCEGRSIGVLQLETLSSSDRFREEDLRVLMAVANQAAIAINNARLHERLLRQWMVERDLELADAIQRSFLPSCPPQIPQYEFFDYFQPALYVGGDFYDYITLPDGRLAVVIADVVGHGLAAAMLAARLAGDIRYRLLTTAEPSEMVTQLNAAICRGLGAQAFTTLVVVVLEPGSGKLTIVNAGHRPPMVRMPDGLVGELAEKEAGKALGILEEEIYQQSTLELPRGAMVLLYTDGIHEAMNGEKEIYDVSRVRRQVEAAQGGPEQLGRLLIDDVRRFARGAPPNDDMCLVCFRRRC